MTLDFTVSFMPAKAGAKEWAKRGEEARPKQKGGEEARDGG